MFLILLLICQWTSLLSWRQPSFRVFNTQRRWNSIHSSLTRTYLTQEPIAVLFDCDGVIAETEEFHRHAFNNAFKGFQLTFGSTNESVYWDVPFYDHLQNTIGGGKEKLWHYFKEVKQDWPTGPYIEYAYPSLAFNKTQQEDMIDLIQTCKNDMFWELIRQKNAIQCRPGFLSLLDELTMQSKDQLKVGICSASTKSSFLRLMYVLLGDQRMKSIDLTIVGDDCPEKKPSPMIYEMASKQLGIPPSRCLVVEDSLIGLRAAKAAGMKCLITYTNNTAEQDFLGNGADLVLPSLQYMTMSDLLSLSPPTPPPQQQHEDESEEEDDYEDPYQERFLYDYVDEEEGNGEDDDQEAEDGLKAKVKTELQRKGSA